MSARPSCTSEVAKEVEMLATALHMAEDRVGEVLCWCRRIATVDTTIDGEQDPHWSSTDVYDPNEWGDSAQRPTFCEQAAKAMLEALPEGYGIGVADGPYMNRDT